MIYLSHKHILHRDLAARNCLLDETKTVVKISDFGLSREMDAHYQYISKANPRLPFRWMPLEALKKRYEVSVFTIKGDVWAFGILIYEIFTRGGELYNGKSLQELFKFLESGNRLPRPQRCPHELYTIMLLCWDEKPESRPTFDDLKKQYDGLYRFLSRERALLLQASLKVTTSDGYEKARAI